MSTRPPIIDAIANKGAKASYIRFRNDWQPGERDKYIVPKEQGKPLPLTEEVLDRHWRGECSIGVHVMEPGTDTTRLGVIDFDNHPDKLGERPYANGEFESAFRRIVEAARHLDLEPTLVRTSGDGYHAIFTWADQQPARAVSELLTRVVRAAQVEAEVFPKQDSVPEGGFGNAISLVGGRESSLLDGDLVVIPREQWSNVPMFTCAPVGMRDADLRERQLLNDNRRAGVVEQIDAGAVADGNRNDTLKALLVRLRKQNGMDETMLRIFAMGFAQEYGMEWKEVAGLIKFASGLPVDDIEGFGSLVALPPKHKAGDSEYEYRLEYKGKWVTILNSTVLTSAKEMCRAVFRQTYEMPAVNVAQWRVLLPQLIERMVIHETEGESEEDSIWEALCGYMQSHMDYDDRDYWTDRAGLLAGHPVIDEAHERIVFMPDIVVNWINRARVVQGKLTRKRLLDVLRARGVGESTTFSVKTGALTNKNLRVYTADLEAVDAGTDLSFLLDHQMDVDLITGPRLTIEQMEERNKKSSSEF